MVVLHLRASQRLVDDIGDTLREALGVPRPLGDDIDLRFQLLSCAHAGL